MQNRRSIFVFLLFVLTSILSVRAEQLVIREIMYHPPEGLHEFIEVENITRTVFDIANWKLRGGVDFDFPDFDSNDANGTFLRAKERMIICGTEPAAFREANGVSSSVKVFGPWTGLLGNGGERITVKDKNGITVCTVRYNDRHPWPVAPDGTGHTLVLDDHNRTIDDYRLWRASAKPGGTPGAKSAEKASSDLAINEVHFTEQGSIDWVEIHNLATGTTATTGLFLASKRDFSDKTALGAPIAGRGFLSLDTAFESSSVLFIVDSADVVVDAVGFERVAGRDHLAAFPDGSKDFYSSSNGSRDGANDPSRETDIVINELMVEMPSGNRDGEFIELYNKGTGAVDLSGWRFVSGVDYRFPAGTTLDAGEYLVIAANQQFTSEAHPNARIAGEFTANLSNNNELLRLEDDWGNMADEVHYHTGGNWPTLAGGQGSSLELLHPEMDNSKPTAWADSDESEKSEFQTFEFSDQYQQLSTQGGNPSSYKELHMHCVGDAHLALKNIELTKMGSTRNLLSRRSNKVVENGDGALGWLVQGTHHLTHMQGDELHLISTGHGDIKANRIEIDVPGMEQNDNLTWTCEARWISGKPTIIVHSFDRSFGDILHLPVPKNLGTPGAPNSVAIAEAVPTVSQLWHSPAIPKSGDMVTVTARVEPAAGNPTVELFSRLDNRAGDEDWESSVMFDNGAGGGDAVANDGIYTAVLGTRSDNSIIQFYVKASSPGGSTLLPPPASEDWTQFHQIPGVDDDHLRPAMYVVDDGAPRLSSRGLRHQRFIISARHKDALQTSIGQSATFNYAFPRLSNQFFNCTFIGNEKDIIYNCETRKAGSPWQRVDGFGLDQGGKTSKWKSPGDRRYRGWSRRSMDQDPAVGRAYHNRITRYWLYLLGHPSNENEFVKVIINGGSPFLRESAETVANDFLKRIEEDGENGELYRIDDEWWFDDNWGRTPRDASWTYKGTDEPERYHAEWMRRSREAEYDYSSFTTFLEAVNDPNFPQEVMERMTDIDMMAANAVVRGWIDDWDNFTRDRGKNGYQLRRHSDGKFMLLQWDSDLTFGNASAQFVGGLTRGFFGTVNQSAAKQAQYYYVKRKFNYYLGEMLDKYTHDSPRLETWLSLEELASPEYSSTASTYNNWNSSRRNRAEIEIGAALSTRFSVSGDSSTSADTIDLTASAGYSVYTLRVVGHPEVVVDFTRETIASMRGIQLREGVNEFTIEGLDLQGNVVETRTHTVTKIGNALPVIEINPNPDSLNVALSDNLVLDATMSYDPEGTALTFEWSVDNQFGADLTNPTAHTAVVSFSMPGHYTISVTATDADGEQHTETREAVVFAESGWSSFSDRLLEDWWTLQNIEVRNDYAGPAWYSLSDRPGQLTIKVNGERSKPLTANSPSHPIFWRSVPDTGDCTLQTDVRLGSVQFGTFMTGLILDVDESGTAARYVFGMEDGEFLRVKRATGGAYTQLKTMEWLRGDAVIRMRRSADQLDFEYRTRPGTWETFLTHAIPADSTLGDGGIFAATNAAQQVRLEFDYVMLIDPAPVLPATDALVISEVMYKPLGGESLEFLELHNTGTTPIDLAGFRFPQDQPFDEFVFGDVTIAPGAYLLVVHNLAAFRAHYGNSLDPVIAGEWVDGNLKNSGDIITVLDAQGITVLSFEYFDVPPWPTSPDTDGTSLVLIDPVNGDPTQGTAWTASSLVGGSPGGPESQTQFDAWMAARGQTDPLATMPGEPVNNLLSYAFGLDLAGGDPAVALPRVGKLTVGDDSFLCYEYRRRLSDPTLGYTVEISRDGLHWSDAAADLVEVGVADEGDGTDRVTVRLKDPLGSEKVVLLRVRVTQGTGTGSGN